MASIFLNRKIFLVLLFLFCSIFVSGTLLVFAQEKFPTKNIELIIPWGTGGLSDVTGRIFAHELSKVLNVPITPVNKPGATGTLGSAYVALQAKKDGYTLLANTQGSMVLAPFALPEVQYVVLRDFLPISIIAISPSLLFVSKDSPLKSLEDLINAAKQNPGKLKYATAGKGTTEHFNVMQLEKAGKIKVTHIPYKSGGEIITATLGGHVDFGCIGLIGGAPQVKAGEARGLAISGNKRIEPFPDIPTFSEKGYTQHFFNNWVGIFAPAGIPKSVVDVLVPASEKVIKSKDYISKIEKTGASVEYMSHADCHNFIEKEIKTAEAVVKEIEISPKK